MDLLRFYSRRKCGIRRGGSHTDSASVHPIALLVMQSKSLILKLIIVMAISTILSISIPVLAQIFIDSSIADYEITNKGKTVTLIVFTLIILLLTDLAAARIRFLASVRVVHAITRACVKRLIRAPLQDFERRSVGEILSRVNSADVVGNFVANDLAKIGHDAINLIVFGVILLLYNYDMAILVYVFAFSAVLMASFASRNFAHYEDSALDMTSKERSHLIETISGILSVKAAHRELPRLREWNRKKKKVFWRLIRNSSVPSYSIYYEI